MENILSFRWWLRHWGNSSLCLGHGSIMQRRKTAGWPVRQETRMEKSTNSMFLESAKIEQNTQFKKYFFKAKIYKIMTPHPLGQGQYWWDKLFDETLDGIEQTPCCTTLRVAWPNCTQNLYKAITQKYHLFLSSFLSFLCPILWQTCLF